MTNVSMFPFSLPTIKPAYLPEVLWEKVQHDVKGWRLWYWRSTETLLFGPRAAELFKLLSRAPTAVERAKGHRVWTDDDYLNWLETHCWIHAHYIAQDRHSDFYQIKNDLCAVAAQAEKLAGALSSLFDKKGALSGSSDLLPRELKRLSCLYRNAVHVNNERGGQAKHLEELAGFSDTFDASPDERREIDEFNHQIGMHDERQNLPLLSDLLHAVAESTHRHIRRFEADGEHSFTIGSYKPESLPARYIALFDRGLEPGEYHAVKGKALRVSHGAMSLQCSLVFDEDIPKDRVIDIRKRAAAAK